MKTRILYQELANTIQARANCAADMAKLNPNAVSATVPIGDNEWHLREEWFEKHSDNIKELVDNFLPSGSGWDWGTKIDLNASHRDKIVLYGSYHHMDEAGGYDGYTDHTITVTPSLTFGFHLRISGRNRNDIKEYLADIFSADLNQEITWDEENKAWKRAA